MAIEVKQDGTKKGYFTRLNFSGATITKNGIQADINVSGETTDEKVKADASDIIAGYLDSKVDNSTIEVDTTNHQLRVKSGVFANATHTHTEADITDLDHDAQKIKGKVVDDTNIGDGKILKYNATSGNIEYADDNSTDTNAIHKNQSGEIDSLTEKTTPVNADLLMIEDSADSNNKKKIQIGNLPAFGVNGSVQYNDNGKFGGDSDFYWDKTNKRLGIGTSTPERNLDIRGDTDNPGNAFQMGFDTLGNLNLEFIGINKAIYVDFTYTEGNDYDWRIITNNGDTNLNFFGSDENLKMYINQYGDLSVYRAIQAGGPNGHHYPSISIKSKPQSGDPGGSSELLMIGPSENSIYDNAYINFAKKSGGNGALQFRSVWVDDNFGLSGWFGVLTLHENGNATLSGTLTQNSDIKLKENITPLNNGLNTVLQLKPITFNFKGAKNKMIGFIAQDVEQILPEIVYDYSGGYKSISYIELIPVLTQAIKDLYKLIDQKIRCA